MPTYTKTKLSGAGVRNGALYVQYATDVLAHETGTSSTVLDEVWLWAHNHGIIPAQIRIDIGTLRLQPMVPPSTTVLVLAGHPISGTGSATTQVLLSDWLYQGEPTVFGYVNRITP
jgi:hypothetical protein